jgi:hypothetical protein
MTATRLICLFGVTALLGATPSAVAQGAATTRGYAPTSLPPTIPLFPLQDVMLFPGTTRPLHIFEPRYRDMVADALEGNRLIGMVLLEPGYETDYEGQPPIYPIGCVGIIAESEKLPDGGYNILLGGIMKFRITSEDQSRSYRLAHVEAISEKMTALDREALGDLSDELAALVPIGLPGLQLPDGLSDEGLVNGIAQIIDIDPIDRWGLLTQPDPLARGQALIDLLYIRSALPR